MSNNGIVGSSESSLSFRPQTFPNNFPIIAPFWADFDTSCGLGNVYYRQTTSILIRSKASSDIQSMFCFVSYFFPSLVVIVTWDRGEYYSCSSNIGNKVKRHIKLKYFIRNVIDNCNHWYVTDMHDWTGHTSNIHITSEGKCYCLKKKMKVGLVKKLVKQVADIQCSMLMSKLVCWHPTWCAEILHGIVPLPYNTLVELHIPHWILAYCIGC